MKFYAPKGKFLWDLWFVEDKGMHHVFYLQSKRTKNPDARHDNNVVIGHAISEDFKHWKELPVALKPGRKGEWDDLALWTGSVIKKDGKFYMFYTGRSSKKSKNNIQKIGLAVSDDLINWEKMKKPVLEADKTKYDMRNGTNKLGKIGAWRDPFVFEDKGKYYMTISARRKGKSKEFNGCIALAESKDLLKWKVRNPILSPNVFDEMETTQVVKQNGKYYLFFGTFGKSACKPSWKDKYGVHTGLHCYVSNKLNGKYKTVNENGIVVDHAEAIYDIRLVEKKGKGYLSTGWLNDDWKGHFIGKMSKPFSLVIKGNRVLKRGRV